MEDNNNKHKAGSQNPSPKVINENSLLDIATIELQAFFKNLIPDPIDKNINAQMDRDESFSQILASSISQSIDNYQQSIEFKSQCSSNKALQASSLIGRSVLIEDGRFYIEEGQSAQAKISIKDKVQHIIVYVENDVGDIVRLIPLGDGVNKDVSFTWNGITRTGQVADEGEYRFIVSGVCNSRVMEMPVYTYNKIIKVILDPLTDDMVLYFENDITMKLSDVEQILKD